MWLDGSTRHASRLAYGFSRGICAILLYCSRIDEFLADEVPSIVDEECRSPKERIFTPPLQGAKTEARDLDLAAADCGLQI
jgi:hypothetical protein